MFPRTLRAAAAEDRILVLFSLSLLHALPQSAHPWHPLCLTSSLTTHTRTHVHKTHINPTPLSPLSLSLFCTHFVLPQSAHPLPPLCSTHSHKSLPLSLVRHALVWSFKITYSPRTRSPLYDLNDWGSPGLIRKLRSAINVIYV